MDLAITCVFETYSMYPTRFIQFQLFIGITKPVVFFKVLLETRSSINVHIDYIYFKGKEIMHIT